MLVATSATTPAELTAMRAIDLLAAQSETGLAAASMPVGRREQAIVGIRCNHVGAMELRVARHTDRLDEVVAFYRDRVGLPELGRFTDHDGYDGVLLDLPGTGSHLEFTAGGDLPAPEPHPESLLVL